MGKHPRIAFCENLKVGDSVRVVSALGTAFSGVVTKIGKKRVKVAIDSDKNTWSMKFSVESYTYFARFMYYYLTPPEESVCLSQPLAPA